MINEVDVDGNGTVEFAEFVILMTNKVKEMSREDEIREAFKVLDKENDQAISAKELKYFMRKVAHIKLSSEEAKAMIEYADFDEDGMVSFEDFEKIVNKTLNGFYQDDDEDEDEGAEDDENSANSDSVDAE